MKMQNENEESGVRNEEMVNESTEYGVKNKLPRADPTSSHVN